MVGVELRTSRPSAWVQARQRGDSVIVGELVMLDVATSDALTANFTTTNGKNTLGSRSSASSPLATVIPATDALAHGRVGVAMQATADDAIGLYEFGELGDGSQGDVIVQALVLSATANAAGVALEVDVSSSIGRFTLKSAGATFATLLEDTGNTGANVLVWVVLHTGGKGGGGSGGGGGTVPTGNENDIVVLGPGGTDFLAVAPTAAVPQPTSEIGTFVGNPTTAGGAAAAAALTTAQVTAIINARGAVMETDYDAQSILIAVSDNTPVVDAVAAGDIVGRPTGQNVGSYPATDYLADLGLDGAVSYDTTAWAAGTYQPNVVVEHDGRLYFQGDASATTNVPPASPWVFWGYAGADAVAAIIADLNLDGGTTDQVLGKTSATDGAWTWRADATGGGGTNAFAQSVYWSALHEGIPPLTFGPFASGSAPRIFVSGRRATVAIFTHASNANSGGIIGNPAFAHSIACLQGDVSRFAFIAENPSTGWANTTARWGWGVFNWTSFTASPTDGIYAQQIGATLSFKCIVGSVVTTHATTYTLVDGTAYKLSITRNASDVTFILYADDGTTELANVTQGGMPATTVGMQWGAQAITSATPAGAEALVYLESMTLN